MTTHWIVSYYSLRRCLSPFRAPATPRTHAPVAHVIRPLSQQSTITQFAFTVPGPERRRLKSSDSLIWDSIVRLPNMRPMTASSAREVPLRERFRPTERTLASTAVGAASMRTSHPRSVVLGTTAHSAVLSTVYPRSHTDVVLGGAADSAVLSKESRSTSRRLEQGVTLDVARALQPCPARSQRRLEHRTPSKRRVGLQPCPARSQRALLNLA